MKKKLSLLDRSRQKQEAEARLFAAAANDYHRELNILLETEPDEYSYNEDTLSRLFNRNEEPSALTYDEMAEVLETKAFNSYRLRGDVVGLVLLGSTERQAKVTIADYNRKKYTEFDEFFKKNLSDISFWNKMLVYRYAHVTQDAEGTKGEVDAPMFFDDVAKDSKGYRPFITTPNFIYTNQFYNFVMQEWDKLSISAGRRAMSVIRQYNKQHRLAIATKLQYILSNRATTQALGLRNGTSINALPTLVQVVPNPLIGGILEDRGLIMPLSFRTDYTDKVDESNLSRRSKVLVKQVMKCILFANFQYELLPFTEAPELPEAKTVSNCADWLFQNTLIGDNIDMSLAVGAEELEAEEEAEAYELHTRG